MNYRTSNKIPHFNEFLLTETKKINKLLKIIQKLLNNVEKNQLQCKYNHFRGSINQFHSNS